MAKLKTAPLINGGCYEKIMQDGRKFEAMIMGIQENPDGSRVGWLHRYGYPPEAVTEDTESFSGWDLVAEPKRLEEPVRSERAESEVDRLQREVALLKRQQAREEAEATKADPDPKVIGAMRDQGLSYVDIGKKLGIAWQTAKAIHQRAA